MLKKLILTLFLGLVISATAAPIMKSFFGIGSTAAYAAEDDDSQGDSDAQGENGQ